MITQRSVHCNSVHCCLAVERMQQAAVVGEVNELPGQAAAGDQLSTASECHVLPLMSDGNKLMTSRQTADTGAFVSVYVAV